MFLDKYIDEKGAATDFTIFNGLDHADLLISTSDLFMAQYIENDYNAIDVAVKYLAVENYYGLNDFGFELYNKMQVLRTGKDWNDRFLSLIKSFEKGYDSSKKIETDLNYSIHDGAHRFSLSLFYDMDFVNFRLFNANQYRRPYSIDWFIQSGFNKEELEIIKDKVLKLKNKFNVPYYCILWPPARNSYESINAELLSYDDSIQVIDSFEFDISSDKFKEFIYRVYETDDISKQKLDIKYSKILESLKSENYSLQTYRIRVIKFIIDSPNYRVKPITGLPQSKKTMELKSTIRDKYKKSVKNYYHDIIMHVTDNAYQSKEIEKILKKLK